MRCFETKCLERLALCTIVAAGVLLVTSLSGCGGSDFDTAPVRGEVTHQGKPVSGGSVTFRPKATDGSTRAGKPASGIVESDGTYVLGTYGKSDGAVIARHSVSYSAPSVEVKMVEIDGDSRPAGPIPVSPYAGLVPKEKEIEVVSGKNKIDIELVPGQESGKKPSAGSPHGGGP